MSDVSTEVVVLPAANRNCPSVICVSPSGIIAYGSRYQIYFIVIRSHRTKFLDSKIIQGAHRGKVIALSFSKGDVELLASIGDDCQLKVWDIETQTCLNTLEVRESTRNIAWVYGSANILLFSPDPKTISKMNMKNNNYSRIKIGSEISVSAIECNEKSPELVAIGHDNGIVSIVNIVQEKLLQVLKTHSMEVTSLSWSGISPDTLMSVSFDLTVRVWKIKEDKPIWTYYFPSTRQKMDDKKKIRPIGTFHPNKPNVIICTTPRGEMGEITFEEKGKPSFSTYTFLDSEYLKFPTALFCLTDSETKENILLCCDSYKITVADINKQKVFNQVPFLMGFVYDLTNSVVNPNLLAISNGDGILRIWNTQAEGAKIDMMSIYVHYKTKIMTTAWHPTEDNILAYGTDEGRVGIADTYKRRVMYSFETHHSDSVYSLSWGPCEKAHKADGGNDDFYLYSCGGGQVYIHKLKEITNKALNFGDLAEWPPDFETTEKTWTEIAWKPDYSCICLGSSKGCIDVFNDKLIFLARYNVQMKSVECLCWHPEKTYMSPNGSPYQFWLASCGSDNDIHIFDVPKAISITEGEKTQSQEAFNKLVGHKKRIVSLCWSQHDDGFLVSASKDCAALVWNVSTESRIATYLGHKDVVYAVQWSLFDKDVIYSGGQDSSMKVWKISEQKILEIPDKVQFRKKMRKPKKSPASSSSISERSPSEVKDKLSVVNNLDEEKIEIEPEENTEDTLSIENRDSKCVFHQSNEEKKDSDKTTPECKVAKAPKPVKLTPQFAKKFSQLFPELSPSTTGDVSECERLADILCKNTSVPSDVIQHMNLSESEKVSDDDALKCGPFTDQLTTLRMLQVRGEATKAAGDYHNAVQLGVMAANIKSVLQEAAKHNALSAYLVSLAPCVSYVFWREMCEKYAVQLVEDHSYYAASNYYLMCNKIYDAINILAEKENPVDALILAKANLPQSDPIFSKLLFKAAKKYALHANKIGEAKCYLALSDPLMAAKVLASHSDPNFIRAASSICRKFNLEKDADIYAFTCLEKCLLTCNWSSFELLLDQEPKFQVYKALASIHESFKTEFRSLKSKTGIILKDIFLFCDPNDELRIWNGNTCTDEKLSFIDQAYHHLLSANQFDLREMLEALSFLSEKQNISASSYAQVSVSIFITKFIILCHLEEFVLASQVFLKIFEVACNDRFLQKIVSFLLLPLGLYWCKDTKSFDCTSLACVNEKNSVNFYRSICDHVIMKINSFENKSIQSVTIIKEELLLDIQYATNRMCSILSTKTAADYALSYFSASMLDCLIKAVNDKIQPLKCLASLNSNNVSSKSDVTEVALQNGFIDKNSVDEDEKETTSEKETAISGSSSEVDALLQEVIELTLKETEENASSFIKNDSLSTSEVNGIPLETSIDTALSDFVEITIPCTNVNENIPLSDGDIPSKEIIEKNSTNEDPIVSINSHMQCLENIEIFLNILTFIAFNICQDEYALLYYLKRRLAMINAANAFEVLSKFSKENKMESKVSEHALDEISSCDSKKEIKGDKKEVVPKSLEPEETDKMKECVTNGITNSDFSELNLNLSEQNSVENPNLSDSNSSKCVEFNKAVEETSSEQNGLDEIGCENHNDILEVPKESVCFMNAEGSETIGNELISTENKFTNESLSNELPELVELISTLEKVTQIRYPNPFEAIPKILQITYKMKQNSQCCFVQDKLHEFIHEVISWSNKFFDGELDIVCDSCSKEKQ